MTSTLDFTLRDDRYIPSQNRVINEMLAIVHQHIISSMKILGQDTTQRKQDLLRVALPGATPAGSKAASLGRRIVITGNDGVLAALEGNEKFRRLTKFYFRESTADDHASTLAPEAHEFVASKRKTGTLAENLRKLRRLQRRAEARGEKVPEDVVDHLSQADEREPRPSILVRSGTTGGTRSRVLEVQDMGGAPRAYDLWGFALTAAA